MSSPEPPDQHLSIGHLETDLKRRSVRGGAVTIAGQLVKVILHVASTAVLARLLTPAAFGLVAMVTVVTGLIGKFKDAGLSLATVQRESLTHAQVSTLFWINVLVSLVLTLVTLLLAPFLAWAYGDQRLTPITLALAGTFLLAGLSVQHEALLKRQMRFGASSTISVLSQAAGAGAAILAALLGAGFWALVVLNIAAPVANVLLAWTMCGWRPGRPRRGAGVRPLVAFGGHLLGVRLFTFFTQSLDNILVGALFGPNALGLYSRAYGLLMLPGQQVNGPFALVALPALSRLQNDLERYRRFYRRAVEFVLFVSAPLMVAMFVLAEEVVLTLFGPQWHGAIPLFRALGPAALMAITNVATTWVFISLGRTDRQFKLATVRALVSSVGVVIGTFWGAMGVAVAVSTVRVLMKVPSMVYCFKGSPLTLMDFWAPTWRSCAAAILTGSAVWSLKLAEPTLALPTPVRLVALGAVFSVAYLICFALLPRGPNHLLMIWRTIMEAAQRRPAPAGKSDTDSGTHK